MSCFLPDCQSTYCHATLAFYVVRIYFFWSRIFFWLLEICFGSYHIIMTDHDEFQLLFMRIHLLIEAIIVAPVHRAMRRVLFSFLFIWTGPHTDFIQILYSPVQFSNNIFLIFQFFHLSLFSRFCSFTPRDIRQSWNVQCCILASLEFTNIQSN